jgi:hypothetical protein
MKLIYKKAFQKMPSALQLIDKKIFVLFNHTGNYHHHHNHHLSVIELGHLLNRSGLTNPEVS